MNIKKIAQTISMVLGMISFICLIVHFLALSDMQEIRDPSGVPGRLLTYAFWPMFVFHLVFLATTACILIAGSLPSPPPDANDDEKKK